MSALRSLVSFIDTRGNLVLAVLVLAAAVTLPFLLPGPALLSMTKAICYGLGIVGLKLLTGYGGQFSLGHSAFFTLGSYVAFLLAPSIGFAAAVVAATMASFILGALLGAAGLRIKGHYLGLLTFMVALAALQIPKATVLVPYTGGSSGLWFQVDLPTVGTRDLWWYWIAVAVAAAVTVGIHLGIRSRFGRALQASRDNALAARAIGVNTALVDVVTFGVSGACAGIGGAILAGVLGYITNDSFNYTLSILLFVGLAVTGARSLPAAFIGGALIVFVPNWSDRMLQDLSWAIFGATLLALLFIQVAGPRVWLLITRSGGPPRQAGDKA